MSMTIDKCRFCGSTDLEVLQELEPETTALNMRVIMRCKSCGQEGEYRVMSHHTERELDAGNIMV